MLAIERLLEIEEKFSAVVERIVLVEIDEETLRVILYLKDGDSLRVAEQWNGKLLKRYSYYWLSPTNELKVGWDNAPHHTHLESFPDHKHIGLRENLHVSSETCLEDVMRVILKG